MVQAFLWILLGLVLVTFAVNAVVLGPAVLTLPALLPNLLFAGLVGAGLWLNHRHHFGIAVWLIIGVMLLAGSLGILMAGIAENSATLLLFFVPLVLAGLLLGRAALVLTGGITLGVVLVTPLIHGAGPVGVGGLEADGAWLAAVQFTITYVTVAFFLDRFGLVFLDTLRAMVEQEAQLDEQATQGAQAREELLEGRRLNDAIIENLPGIFFMLDQGGGFYRLNRNVTHDLGYGYEELERLGPVALLRDEGQAALRRCIDDVFEHGYASDQLTFVSKDGRQVPYFVRATRVSLGGADYLAGVGIDRSEIDEVQARVQLLNVELEERLERITALREVDRAMTGNLDLAATLDVVLQQVMQRLRVDAVSILLYSSDARTLRYGASRGFKGVALRRTDLRLGEGLAGRAALRREALRLNGREALAEAFAGASSLQHEEFEGYMAVPLVSKGELQGVLELFNYVRLEPDDDWTDFLLALATQAALALDTTRVFERLERSNRELRLAYDTTIEGWARALDLKDEDTEGHSRRVTELTERLARRLGMSEEELVHVRRGALLHDIGKMGIPDHVLRKPGPLGSDEWELMKQHTTFAHDFLAPIPFLRPALEIPYCHHEKFDGSGYPLGLRGEHIPLSARLFAVVDVFDALTSDRPYRAAWSEARALQHVRSQAGRQFDPAVVEEFMAMMLGRRQRVANG